MTGRTMLLFGDPFHHEALVELPRGPGERVWVYEFGPLDDRHKIQFTADSDDAALQFLIEASDNLKLAEGRRS